MHVLFDFIPDKDLGVAVVYKGYYRVRQGNYCITTAAVEKILLAASLPTDFSAGELAFRSKVYTGGCIVTCPPVVGCRLAPAGKQWREDAIRSNERDPLVTLLLDNAPIDNMPPPALMWELNVLGGTFEVEVPTSIAREYRRGQVHASLAAMRQGNIEFSPDCKVTGPRLFVATPVPEWFRLLADYSGAYPKLPFTWINHIRSQP